MSTVTDPFMIPVTSEEGGDYERPEPGMYPARLVAAIDLGTHDSVFQGKTNTRRSLFFVWELCGENNSEGEAFTVGQDYTRSLGAKANLRKLVESWTGKALGDQDQFNVSDLFDRPCLISISEGQSASGKKFSEIKSVGPAMKGQVVPELTRQPFVFSLAGVNSSTQDPEIPDWVPFLYGKPVIDKIKASKEWADLPAF